MPILREKEDQNVWNFLFSVLFVALVLASIRHMYVVYGGLPQDITFFDLVLIVLAVFRLTRLFVYDMITRFVREWFVRKEIVTTEKGEMVELTQYAKGPLRTISDLLSCPWCTGVWFALPVTYAYFMYDWAWYVILVLAVAGVATLVQITTNLIGWQAELGKMAAQAEDSKCG
ncbi:MAG TPA: DUF1360 domain-containing protein [Candidatus Paceibacterota bacterium]